MIKTLLLLALVFLVAVILRTAQAPRVRRDRPRAERAPEAMVKCAYCGVNQPVSESLLTQGRYYCCAAHRRAAERRDD